MKTSAILLALAATSMTLMHSATATEEVHENESCHALHRDINFSDSETGAYSDADLLADFTGYQYFKRRDQASIVDIDGDKYLDIKLKKGCVGTVADKGCGMMGDLPLFGMSDQATLEYTVRFKGGYDFRRGGKIMGLCSGACKSGCQISADQGFSARLMWGPEGSLYIYTYTYSGSTRTCGMNTKPDTAVKLETDRDYRIRLTVKMNDPDQENGIVSMYIDGEHIVSADGLRMRNSAEQVVDRMVFHTFFGGSGSDWEAVNDEHIQFKSIKIWDGDCGGSDGATEMEAGTAWEASGAGNHEGSRLLKLDTHIYGSWGGRFCLWYDVTNDGEDDCDRFILETNVNPSLAEMATYKNLQVLESDDESGFYMFAREKEKDAFLQPGKTMSGNICLEMPENISTSDDRINSNYEFHAYCESS